MSRSAPTVRRSWPERLYRWSLRLYPHALRRQHGPEMVALFRQLEQRARSRGGTVGSWLLLARALFDVLRTAPAARRFERRRAGLYARHGDVHSVPPGLTTDGRRLRSGGASPLRTLRHDLSIALRLARKSPGFTALAATTLALGIGANTAIFSVVYGVLLRPFGLDDPASLAVVHLHRQDNPGDDSGFQPSYLSDVRERVLATPEVAGLTSYLFESVTLFEDASVQELDNVIVADARFFETMGAKPLLGRLITPDDTVPRRLADVCVIDAGFWRSHFGADPEIIGRTIVLDERPRTIVGVLPSGLPLPTPDTHLWLMADWDPEDAGLLGRINVLARLAPGASIDQAEARFVSSVAELRDAYPRYSDYTVALQDFREALIGAARPALLLASVGVGLILLIACANIANLLSARAETRRREMATRRALGASSWQLGSQLMAESGMLSLLGGASGIALAFALHHLLLRMAPAYLPRIDAVRLDLPVLAFATVASLVTGALFGLAPILHTFGAGLAQQTRANIAGRSAGYSRRLWRRSLVVGQVGMAVLLLVAASLMVRSLLALRGVDPGFESGGVGGARIYLDSDKYRDDAGEAAYWRQLLEQLQERPDIASAGASSGLPLDPVTIDYDLPFTLPGEDPGATSEHVKQASFRTITPGYIETLRIPLIAGRTFDERDRADSERVALINEQLARLAWPDRSPLGESFFLYNGRRRLRVVGVVGDVHFKGPTASFKPELFVPYTQATYGAMSVVARSKNADGAARAIAEEALALDRTQPVNSSFTLPGLLDASLSTDRFLTRLLVTFGSLALLLSAVGIYGLISYSVNQGRRELGVRLAFGASRKDIVQLVLARSCGLAAAGLLIGLATSLALGRPFARFLFHAAPTDPAALATVTVVLVATGVLAGALPARRAARLDPMASLRSD